MTEEGVRAYKGHRAQAPSLLVPKQNRAYRQLCPSAHRCVCRTACGDRHNGDGAKQAIPNRSEYLRFFFSYLWQGENRGQKNHREYLALPRRQIRALRALEFVIASSFSEP